MVDCSLEELDRTENIALEGKKVQPLLWDKSIVDRLLGPLTRDLHFEWLIDCLVD